MSNRNKIIAVVSVLALCFVLYHGLHAAWIGLRVGKLAFVAIGCLGVGFLAGRFSK